MSETILTLQLYQPLWPLRATKPPQEKVFAMASSTLSLTSTTCLGLAAKVFFGIVVLLYPLSAMAADSVDAHPGLTRLSPRHAIWIDAESRQLVVGGSVTLNDGPIEFFACPRKTKEHESIVAVDATAKLIHAGLLAIGLRPGSPASFYPEFKPATGDLVAIRIRWRDDTEDHETSAQTWVKNSQTGEELDCDWIFAGSSFWKDPRTGTEYYQADAGDLVCVSNFPAATLDLPITSSQANESLLFETFTERIPPRGTPVELVFFSVKQKPVDVKKD